jgi:Ca2+-binding EF-hand superfamily protein
MRFSRKRAVAVFSVVACDMFTTAGSAAAGSAVPKTPSAGEALFGKALLSTEFSSVTNKAFELWLSKAFATLDSNKDGVLQVSEAGERIVALLDTNNDFKISLGEMTLSKARALFDALDVNSDGEMATSEVPEALVQLVEIHDGFVENNDGKLDAVEFSQWHASYLKSRGRSMSWAEIIILVVAGGVSVAAVGMSVQSWQKNTSGGKDESSFLGAEEYALEYPPEVLLLPVACDGAD